MLLGDELVFIKKKKDYPKHANCIWSMYVTAYARHRLYYEGLIKVEQAKGLLLYCDTDSVIFESKRNIIKHSKELGSFKLEGIFRYAHFKLPKLYHLIPIQRNKPHIFKAKGVPNKQAKTFFLKSRAKYRKPNKLRESLRRNLSPNRTYDLIPNFWEVREKEIRGSYTKRKVLKTGHTIPCVLRM